MVLLGKVVLELRVSPMKSINEDNDKSGSDYDSGSTVKEFKIRWKEDAEKHQLWKSIEEGAIFIVHMLSDNMRRQHYDLNL